MKLRTRSASASYNFSDWVVVVTGGAQGIGRGIIDRFIECGATAISLDIQHDSAKLVDNDGVWERKLDVSSEAEVETVVGEIIEQFGAIDVLVNNAAIQGKDTYHPVHTMAPDVWRKVVDVNLTGYYLMAHFVVPHMLKHGFGRIVNMASAQAHRSAREVPAYGSTKAANRLLTMQMALDYSRDGIRVNSVSPGATRTPLVLASLEEQGGEAGLANRHPIGRLAEPREIANPVLWLVSDESSFVTGTDLSTDGGLGAFGAFADEYPLPAE